MVECVVGFVQVHDLGPIIDVNPDPRFLREIRAARISRFVHEVGGRVEFATRPAALAFVQYHDGKYRFV